MQSGTQPGDMGRRVAGRRVELGLTLEDLAAKTGIDPGYLQYFEDHADARLSAGSTLLLAQVLETTPAALMGRVERGTGRGRAGSHPQLQTLTAEQCEAHLGTGGVGRIVFSTEEGPVALPVNFEYSNGNVVISTDVAKAHALESEHTVSFEIDRIDDVLSEGWSVLVKGPARRVDDPDEVLSLASLDLESWAGGERHALVAIRPREITGRVIVHPINFAE
jgi:nitroimidazol reductase NimA-like FMN-containing flavoprotein (pyridoxamine 5'-phosphate oxidase superfamily)